MVIGTPHDPACRPPSVGLGYAHGIGAGSGNSLGELRSAVVFDVVLVIDGTGSMNLIIDDVKAKSLSW